MPRRPSHFRRLALGSIVGLVAVGAMTVASAVPAGACGGLVGENGTIELVRTSTLSAYHDGVERYVTSFEFTGEGEEVGSIVPLPDVPTKVERGGDWTLQRLAEEVAPKEDEGFSLFGGRDDDSAGARRSSTRRRSMLSTSRWSRAAATRWGSGPSTTGSSSRPDAPEVLDFYAERSPIFMAARFDASRAAELGQSAGQGTPIMVTIPTDQPWVPLRILGLGLDETQQVEADVFVLTDEEPKLLAGGPGLGFESQ